MSLPFELSIALRYTRAGRRGRRKDGFMSFISGMSVASIALGVMALIIVLSVMNGFQKEVRDRMLSVIAHAEISRAGAPIDEWSSVIDSILSNHSSVTAAAPFIAGQALLSTGQRVQGAQLRGVMPGLEEKVTEISTRLILGELSTLEPKSFHVILGKDLANRLRARVGSKVTIIVPSGSTTPAGFVPRMKQFTVTGIIESGHYEFDSTLALIHLDDASTLFRTGSATGIQLKLNDLYAAPQITSAINADLPNGYFVSDWTRQNRTWFAAVQVEKRMMGIILFLIVLVGAFGLVSTLVMTVKEKQGDIAILRTMGASRASIMSIFMIQGSIVGFIGVAVGVSSGLLIACNVDIIVSSIEQLFGVQFLPREIYFISAMPSDPRASDIIPIAILSFLMSLVATLYPSWRAAKVPPAEALRYE